MNYPRKPSNEKSIKTDRTHCGLASVYGVIEVLNIVSGNGLLADSTKLLPDGMLNKSLENCSEKF